MRMSTFMIAGVAGFVFSGLIAYALIPKIDTAKQLSEFNTIAGLHNSVERNKYMVQ